MYANGKKTPIETIPRMGERGKKENGEFNYDIFDML
jgi:hypothetical protein